MQADFANKLKQVLSNERLEAYQQQLASNNGDLIYLAIMRGMLPSVRVFTPPCSSWK